MNAFMCSGLLDVEHPHIFRGLLNIFTRCQQIWADAYWFSLFVYIEELTEKEVLSLCMLTKCCCYLHCD